MVTLESLRSGERDQVLRLASLHGARNIKVFGSVARGESTDRSDVDLLVDWEPGRSLLDQVALVQDLEAALGVRVHLGTERSLHWYVRDRILCEATPL
jgi:predicted nucleotidyltransferase